MDQLPHSRPDAFANNGLYGDSQQQFNYDNLFSSAGPDQSSYDNSWGVNPTNYLLPQSRAQAPLPSWASHNPNRSLHGSGSTPLGNSNAQPSPYSRPVSQSPAPYGQQGYNGYNPTQNFQYQQSQPQYDPALFQSSHPQNFNYPGVNYQIPNAKTIAPQALQHDSRSSFGNRPNVPGYQAQSTSNPLSNNAVDQKKFVGSIPAGADSGLFSIIDFDSLSRATNTTRMGNFVNVGNETLNWDINRAAIPNYTARRSRNELRKAAGNDSRVLAKIGKKSTKLQRIAAAPKTPLAAASAQPSDRIKYEGDSSSEESSSEDDDSSDSSDDDTDSAPLPSKRPEGVKAGTEYDAIKTVWRSKKKTLSADSIRKGLLDFWELTKTIRDRWKADANAVEEAKKNNQKSQLPLLESRVKDGRDMMEVAFRAALKHGHRSIVEMYVLTPLTFPRKGPLSRMCDDLLGSSLNLQRLRPLELPRLAVDQCNGCCGRDVAINVGLSAPSMHDDHHGVLHEICPPSCDRGSGIVRDVAVLSPGAIVMDFKPSALHHNTYSSLNHLQSCSCANLNTQ